MTISAVSPDHLMYPRGALARVDSRAASRYAGGHMIKRMEFATRRRDVTLATFAESWRDVVSGRAEAPRPVRPRHIALKLALVGEAPVSKHGGVSVEVDDRSHLERFEEWRRHDRHLVDPPGGLGGRRGGQPGGPGERGRPARRRVARRARLGARAAPSSSTWPWPAGAAHLTPAVFSQRWRSAGSVVRARARPGPPPCPTRLAAWPTSRTTPCTAVGGRMGPRRHQQVSFDDEAASEEVLLEFSRRARPEPPGVP